MNSFSPSDNPFKPWLDWLQSSQSTPFSPSSDNGPLQQMLDQGAAFLRLIGSLADQPDGNAWQQPVQKLWQDIQSQQWQVLQRWMPPETVPAPVAVGPLREWQEKITALQQQAQHCQQSFARYQAFFQDLPATVQQRLQQQTRPESPRALYDQWIECAEAVYLEKTSSAPYSELYGTLINALMQWRKQAQELSDQVLELSHVATTSALRQVQNKQHHSRRQQRQQQQSLNNQLQQQQTLIDQLQQQQQQQQALIAQLQQQQQSLITQLQQQKSPPAASKKKPPAKKASTAKNKERST